MTGLLSHLRRAVPVIFAGALLLVYGSVRPVFAEIVHFSIFSVNDFHGHIQSQDPTPGVTREQRLPVGGAAYLSGHLKRQAAGKNFTFVGVGDLVGASPLISSLTEDQATFHVLGEMGMRFSALGNHELDRGFQWLATQYRLGCKSKWNPSQCLFDGFDSLKIQYLAANVSTSEYLPKVFLPYIVEEKNGLRIAYIGLVTQDTPKLVVPTGILGLVFKDEVEALQGVLDQIRRERVDVVVVMLHEGGAVVDRSRDTPSSASSDCSPLQGNLRRILDQLPAGVDVLLTGHTHQEYICTHKDTLVVQGLSYGTRLSEVMLRFDTATRTLLKKDAVNHVVTQDSSVRDERIERLVTQAREQTAARSQALVADNVPGLTRAKLRDSESSALGNFIADLMYHFEPAGNVDAALINTGSLRSDLSPMNGRMTYGDIYSVQPFGNDWVVVSLTGEQLLTALRQQWEGRRDGRARFMQVSESLEISYIRSGDTLSVETVKIKGDPISLDRQYRLVINSFMFAGGDGFDIFAKGQNAIVLGRDIDLLQQSFKANLKKILASQQFLQPRVVLR